MTARIGGQGISPALALARRGWVVLFVFLIALYFASIPIQFEQLHLPCLDPECPNFQLTPENMTNVERAGISLDAFAAYAIVLNTGLSLAFWVVGALIFATKSRDWMGVYVATTLILFGPSFSNPFLWIADSYPFSRGPLLFFGIVGSILFVVFLIVFPDGRFVPRWTAWFVPFIVVRETVNVLYPDSPIGSGGIFVEMAMILFSQIYRYRRVSTPAQRQQTKWVLYGMVVTVVGFVGVTAISLLPSSNQVLSAAEWLIWAAALYLFISAIPFSIGMAILRSRLWDIDILIRRTLIYGVLTAILVLFYFASVVLLQQIIRTLTGQSSDLAIILSTLAIAALFNPLRQRIQQIIDQRFFRRKYDAARVLGGFAATVRDEVDLQRLTDELLVVVEETMQPENVSLWLKE